MERNSRDLLEGVRSLNEETKRKVLIVSSVAVMAVVIAIWFVYFNNIIMAPAPAADVSGQGTAPTAAAPTPAESPSSSAPGFWHTVGNDLSGLANIFTGGHEYIQPSH